MKRFIWITVCLWCGIICVDAQKEDFQRYRDKVKSEFHEFRKSKKTEFENFRKARNEEFARFLVDAWKNYTVSPPRKVIERPEPVAPVIYDKRKSSVAPTELPNPHLVRSTPLIKDIPLTVVPLQPQKEDKLSSFRFYKDYPQCEWNLYGQAALSFEFSDYCSGYAGNYACL